MSKQTDRRIWSNYKVFLFTTEPKKRFKAAASDIDSYFYPESKVIALFNNLYVAI